MQMERAVRLVFLKDDRLRPVLRCIVYVIAAVFCAAFLTGVLTMIAGGSLTQLGSTITYRTLLLFELSQCAAVVGVAILLRRYLDRRSVASLGMSFRGRWMRLLLVGITLGAGMQCLVFAIEEILGYSHVTAIASAGADAIELAKFVPLFALVAVAEEMSMRGYLFQNLWEEWGVIAAVTITTALFALLHLGNPNSRAQITLTVAGLAAYAVWACLSVIWTKSLWPAIGVHFAWNLFEGPVLGFPVSGLNIFDVTAISQRVAGPDWFTGGSFGPESGASSLVALAVGLAVLNWLYRRGAFSDPFDARESYALASNEKR